MAQLVFVDLETTGLDVEQHGIIEIACIFETDGKRRAEACTPWSTLETLNTPRLLPPFTKFPVRR